MESLFPVHVESRLKKIQEKKSKEIMSQRAKKVAAAAANNEEMEHSPFVSEILDTLEAKRPKNDAEKTAISVAKILTPIMATTFNRVMEPAMKGIKQMQSAIRVNCYANDSLQQYGRRENLRISGLPEEKRENLRLKVIKFAETSADFVQICVMRNEVRYIEGKEGAEGDGGI